MRVAVASGRFAIAAAVLVAVAATFWTARQPVNPLNFFGFFTIQSNLGAAAAEVVAGIGVLRGRSPAVLLRAATTTYILLTGVVYNTLLTGVAGGVALPWANTTLHTLVPAAVVLDWIVARDRPALPWRRLPAVIPYPLLWLIVVLVRGATDGWVPYPFLSPSLGCATVAAYCGAITAAVLVFAALVWAASRLPVRRRANRS